MRHHRLAFLGLAAAALAALTALPAAADTNLARTCFAPDAASKSFTDGNDCPEASKGWVKPNADTIVLSTTTGVVTYGSTDSRYRPFGQVAITGQITRCTADITPGQNPASGDLCPGTARGSVLKAQIPNDATPVPEKPVGSTAVVSWKAPTLNTDGSALKDLASFRVYRGATAEQLSIVATITNPAATSYESPGLTAGQHWFAVTAVNAAGAESAQSNVASVNAVGVPKPTVTLSVAPADGVERVVPALTWSSTNATSCTSSGGWSGTRPVAGNFTAPAITASTTYRLSCTGPGGTAETSAAVGVSTRPAAVSGVTVTLKP